MDRKLGDDFMKKFGITLAIILSILMLLIGGGFIFANYVINSTLDQMVMTESITKEEAGITEQIIQKKKNQKWSILRYLVSIKMVMDRMGVVMR